MNPNLEKAVSWVKKTFVGEIFLLLIAPFLKGNAFIVFIYMIFLVVGLGNMGLWHTLYEFFQDNPNIANFPAAFSSDEAVKALITFSPPVIGVSIASLLLGNRSKILTLFGICTIPTTILIALLLLNATFLSNESRLTWAIVLTFVALLVWWIAHGSDDMFDEASPDAPAGGDVERELHGSLNGFDMGEGNE